jgi:hypothetical protein
MNKTQGARCKTNVKMNFYYVNICKHEHDKDMLQDHA